ncbi:MAG: Fpg/Nei family DNA glycosylase [bacterium]
MPELPDVEILRRYLDATSLHQSIEGVEVRSDRLLESLSAKKLQSAIKGRSFEETFRHGKFLFAHLDDNGWLVLHFGMSGYLKYFKQMDHDPSHDRLLIGFSNGYHLAYVSQRKLGSIGLTDEPGAFVKKKGLGPDALSPDMDFTAFKEALSGRRGSIKSALMNQEILAGIGNIYCDEILFQAGVFPKSDLTGLNEETMQRIFKKLKEVLQTAIDKKADPSHMPDTWLIPLRGTDRGCPRCGGDIATIKVSGRTAYYCPRCQGKAGE